MRLRKGFAAAALLAALVAGCGGSGGGGGGAVPRGNPDVRFGPRAVDNYSAVELLRALIVASSDAYYAGASAADARTQLLQARSNYAVLADQVRAADPVVDREVVARFNLLQHLIRSGIAPDHYRDLATPLGDQLMDGVMQAIVPPKGQRDRGIQAEALSRVVTRMDATYDTAASGGDPDTDRLAYEQSWGLWRRALTLTAILKPYLGSKKNMVAGTLNNLRGTAFMNGPLPPDAPDATKADAATQRVTQALVARFGLTD